MFYFSKKKFLIITVSILAIVLSAKAARAAVFYPFVNKTAIAVGDIIFVEVKMDTEDQLINVVEGEIIFFSESQNIDIRDFSLAGSDLKFWPRSPSLETKENKIYFSGGVPGGVNKDNALLFKFAVIARSPGQVVLKPANVKAYQNDGKATLAKISIKNLTINISSSTANPVNELNDIITKDSQSPQNLTASIGQDVSVFEGKKFLTFSAVDDESGIDRYEVQEGNRPLVQSGSTYVLQNQEKLESISVTVYDKAENISKILLRPIKQKSSYGGFIIIFIIFLVLSYVLFRFFKLIKKKNANTKQ